MTRQRGPLYILLAVVAVAAAVLSFAALRDLALLCGFSPALAWLLPVTVDAGAASGSFVWLARWTPPAATAYGRTLALLLLASSVGGNALGHGLSAYDARPHWLVVVGVSAIAPAVLGALVHLVVLVGRAEPVVLLESSSSTRTSPGAATRNPTRKPEPVEPERAPLHSVPSNADPTPPSGIPVVKAVSPARTAVPTTSARVDESDKVLARVREMVAAGNGRPAIAKTLGVKDHVARTLMAKASQ